MVIVSNKPSNVFGNMWTWYREHVTSLGVAISHGLGNLGGFVSRRTKSVVTVVTILMLVCAVGWLNFDLETDGDKLWVPQYSKAKKDGNYVKENYGTSTDASMLVLSTKPKASGNVITLESTWHLFRLDQKIRQITISSASKSYNYSTLCYKSDTGACRQSGYLNFWNMSFRRYLRSVRGSETDSAQGNITQLFLDINQHQFPDGQAVSSLAIFGGVQLTTDPPGLTGSNSIMLNYPLDRDVPQAAKDKWMNNFLDLMDEESKRPPTPGLLLTYYSAISVDNEIGASVNKDLYLVAIAVLVFIVVAVICLSKFDRVLTRSSLAVVGLLSSVLAMLAGYGLSMGFGLPFTTLHQTLPFILVGVSVDVMIILTHAYDDSVLEDPSLPMVDRFIHIMRTAGTSVAVTTLASAVAFALGTITKLPAITYFSAFATLSVFCIFVAQVTFFLGVFILTERRIAARRLDCCCCCFTAAPAPIRAPSTATTAGALPPSTSLELAKSKSAEPVAVKKPHATWMSAVFDKYYAPALLSWPTRVVVIAAFVGFAVFSGWAFNHLRQGQPLEELAPDDSYLQDFIRVQKATFDKQLGSETMLVFRGFDQSTPAAQSKMLRALAYTLDTNKYINNTISAFQDNWLISFIGYAAARNIPLNTSAGCANPYVGNKELAESFYSVFLQPQQLPGCVPQDRFYKLLDSFLANPSFKDLGNVITRNSNGTIRTSTFELYHTADDGSHDNYPSKVLDAVRSTEDRVNAAIFEEENAGAKKDVFLMYNDDYNNGEGLQILGLETLLYVVMALAGVGAVMLLMLVHPLAMVLMILSVGLVDLFLFGEMYVLGIRFNYVSVINMIMATGLAVDYSVYLAHKFMHTHGETRTERMHTALSETGAAVFLGALTSLSGTIPLAFASSTILRTFFALLFGTVVFASLTGLVLMPVLFATIGPAALSGSGTERAPCKGEDASPV